MLSLDDAQKWYPDADPVHDFRHIQRVFRMAKKIGEAEGADLKIVLAAALLHDAEGSAPEREGGEKTRGRAAHHLESAAFAGEVLTGLGWSPEKIVAVQHCIRAHRFRSTEAPATLEARVLFDADKLDVLGAVGAAWTVVYAALADQPIFAEPSRRFIETGEKEPGEPHSSYHEFIFKLQNVKDRMYTPTGRRIALARHDYLVSFYAQLAAETRGER